MGCTPTRTYRYALSRGAEQANLNAGGGNVQNGSGLLYPCSAVRSTSASLRSTDMPMTLHRRLLVCCGVRVVAGRRNAGITD